MLMSQVPAIAVYAPPAPAVASMAVSFQSRRSIRQDWPGEASALWQVPDGQTLTGKRDRAILATLLGCGLRRRELAELAMESLQHREARWAIVDFIGKERHNQTVRVPNRVKEALDVVKRSRYRERPALPMCLSRG